MLLSRATADRIARGEITVVLRRWNAPWAVAGGAAISRRLARWDSAAETPWTHSYLDLVAANQAVRAPDLAARAGLEVPRFKRRVRQLKSLGLTISLDVGYRLSPRGRAYLYRVR